MRKNLKRLLGFGLAVVMILGLSASAFAVQEQLPTRDTYTTTVNADVPETIGRGSEIALSFDVARTNVDGSTSDEFRVMQFLSFSYDTGYFMLSYEDRGAGAFLVEDNNGSVEIKSDLSKGYGSHTDADLPVIKLTVRSDVDISTEPGFVRFDDSRLIIAGTNFSSTDGKFNQILVAGEGMTEGENGPVIGGISVNETVTVSFDTDGKAADIESVEVLKGAAVTLPEEVTVTDVSASGAAHYEFIGWASEKNGAVAESFVVEEDMTLYAVFKAADIEISKPNPENPTTENPGIADVEPSDGPKYKEDYTARIEPYDPEVYDYTVTYTNPDTGKADVPVNVDPATGEFTVSGEDVTEGLEIVITVKVKGDFAVLAYTGDTAMIRWIRDKSEDGSYSFQGVDMVYTDNYGGAYVALVRCTVEEFQAWKETATAQDLKWNAGASCATVSMSRDTNDDGSVDFYDANYIIAAFTDISKLDITDSAVAANLIRCDQDASGNVDSADYTLWVKG